VVFSLSNNKTALCICNRCVFDTATQWWPRVYGKLFLMSSIYYR